MADKQTASSKLEQKNAAMDKAQEEGRKRYEKEEIESNQAPRKAVSDAIDYVKGKAKDLADSDFAKGVRNYGRTYKEGLGMQPDTPYEKKKGGMIKSASARADGCCIRGKTRA
jgi:hypothetical protein